MPQTPGDGRSGARRGDAGDLPFEAGSFDAVLCQSALMFFPDRTGALREMARVADGAFQLSGTGPVDLVGLYDDHIAGKPRKGG